MECFSFGSISISRLGIQDSRVVTIQEAVRAVKGTSSEFPLSQT